MTKRRVVLNAEVDSQRAFPILINYSNLSHNKDGTVSMYLDDIVALRAQLPMKKGVFATHGLSENKVHDLQAGAGIFSDVKNMCVEKLETYWSMEPIKV